MAHEIGLYDNVALNRVKAWHGLGQVVSEDMSPSEAYNIAFPWKVGFPNHQTSHFPGRELVVKESRTLYRLPNNESDPFIEMGTHGLDYVPLQNDVLVEIAYLLGADVKVESAGSLFNGKKVFMSLRSETFAVRNDQIDCYLALMNSHDGSLSLTVLPTSTRVVCNNTLTQAYNAAKKGKKLMTYRHFKSISDIVERIKKDLEVFNRTNSFKESIEAMASKKLDHKVLLEYWSKAIAIASPTLKIDEDQKEIDDILHTITTTMETESLMLGEPEPTAWLAANAVTNWIQHSEPSRKQKGWEERRSYNNLIGDTADKCSNVMALAGSLL